MKRALVLALLATLPAGIAGAQDLGGRTVSVDLGLGVSAKPSYPGADDSKAGAWLIWRNFSMSGGAGGGNRQGFSFSPSFSMQASREASDDASLTGMADIDRAYELGGKVSYGFGDLTAYGSVRRGFDGHEGLTGEVGAKYRTDLSDRVTLWSGIELGYGNDDYNGTYFGVTPAEAAPGRPAYSAGGGFNSAAITFEARYALTDSLALLGQVEYGKLIGDAADSPIVQDKYQPALRLGIVRKFSFGF